MNIVGLLKTILIIVAVYYLVTFVNRFFLNRYVRRVQRMREEKRRTTNRSKREGEVTIEDRKKNGKGINKDLGDYIDYEEIKEDQ